MKPFYKFTAGVVASMGLGVAVAVAHAHPGQMGAGMGPQAQMKGDMMGGMGPGAMHGAPAGASAAQQLMTPEERTALIEKMRNAKTPEERRQIAEANHAEMQKRATEKGITLPEQRDPHGGLGPRFSVGPQSPGVTENAR